MKVAEYHRLVNPLAHCNIRIGVDAGKKTGIAVYSMELPDSEAWFLHTKSFWDAYDFIKGYPAASTGIIIEVPNAKRHLYARKDGEGVGRGRERMAANVGSNRREAELLASRFESLGFPVVRVTPKGSKWSAKELERFTGITELTNEHVRDAVRLVFDSIPGKIWR